MNMFASQAGSGASSLNGDRAQKATRVMHSGKDQPKERWTVVVIAIVLLGLILLIPHFVAGRRL
jgi:hypothetical protein